MLDSAPISVCTIASLFDDSMDCVKVIDTAGRLIWMNSGGLCTMQVDDFGMVDGALWPSFWPEPGRTEVERAITCSPPKPHHFTAQCPTAKGTQKWWDVSVVPINDDAGLHYGFLATSRDVTEREVSKALSKTLLQEMRHRQGNQMTIASMLMSVHAAQAPALRDFADDMSARLAAVGRAQAVVGREEDDAAAFELRGLMATLVQPMVGPACTLDISAAPGLSIRRDMVDLVGVVLSEMAVNSVKHGAFGKGGHVDISARADDAELTITWAEESRVELAGTAREGAQGVSLMHRMAKLNNAEFTLEWTAFGPEARLVLAV
ncbi:MAG: PAS domain-containing protein [Pseudomonadota bacterium]